MRHLSIFTCLFLLSVFALAQSTKTLLFVGSYTDNKPGRGIYVYEFDQKTGELSLKSSIDSITNPSFLNLSPDGHFLYAAIDTRLPDAGSVMAFKIDSVHGKLTKLNSQRTGGENPVYVT